ncbi:MAG: methyl-accepting chemotaxis protein [Butyrivibrio sp.]|uniref:methyl-accepting chemotaxis protein n=1 Tax=Butyrivibrio sp. TaxID=28121 RepID=UPI001AFD8125|nr:methyl-accepting chemotaxis protein [Butyrivibrio sp.]MBO6240145.1 methyl-accepting chemotaxis protein [Butyrivibrio sp.]
MAKEGKNTTNIRLKDSIKTRLIVAMLLVTIVPLTVATVVSYVTSTSKAKADAIESLEWQAWYMEDIFTKIIDKNVSAMKTLASAPSTITYLQDPDAGTIPDEVMLGSMNAIDEYLADDSATVITSKTGMQVLRTFGDCVDVSEREYFKQAMSGTPIYVSDVITSKSTGSRQITIAIPVYDNETGEILGCVQRNYDMVKLHEILASEFEDAYVADRTGMVAAHSQYIIGQDVDEEDRSGSYWYTASESEGYYESNTGKGYTAYVAFVKEPNTNFTVCVAAKSNAVMAEARKSATIVIIIGVILIAIAAVISFMMANNFTEPIKGISKSLQVLKDGRFEKVDKYDKRKDEFGEISRDTNSVIDTLSEIVSNIKESAAEVGKSSGELSDMANQISQTAEDVSNAVQEIATGATQQADEIQHASENVGRIGDAVGDVQSSTGSLSELAGKMKEASEVSSKSLADLQNSSNEMTEKIDEISQTIQATQAAVNNISDKVEGITNIATQTNLLSLNASIEAARAGEAGKGFAVVAEEIGKLAEDSKSMADEIRKEMDILLEQAQAAVGAAEDVRQGNNDQQLALGETLDAVNGMLEDIGSTVSGVKLISEGAETCDSSKNAVVDTMSALSAISEENAASSEETGASMQELSATVTTLAGSANELKEIADKLNEEMKFFKS